MDLDVVNILVTAALVYGALFLERQFYMWRWRRARRAVPPLASTTETKGFVAGAAQAVACGRCGAVTQNFYEYADGDHWCPRCDDEVD